MPQKFRGPSFKNLGHKNFKFLTIFHDFRTKPRISPEKNVTSTNKNANAHLQQQQQRRSARRWIVDLLSVTFDPETAEIRLLIVTHPSAAITLQPS